MTVKVCPAMVMVPVRGLVLVFAVADQVTVPAPLPLDGVQVNQVEALLEVVQVQVELDVETVTVPLLMAEPELAAVGEME